MLQACTQAVDKAATDLDFLRLDPASFQKAPNISIDYAVMEKTPACRGGAGGLRLVGYRRVVGPMVAAAKIRMAPSCLG